MTDLPGSDRQSPASYDSTGHPRSRQGESVHTAVCAAGLADLVSSY